MPYTLKPNKIFAKDPNGDGYLPQNVVTDQSTDEQVALINSTGASQLSAIQTKGEQTLASIPEDYTALQGEVDDLEDALNDLGTFKRTTNYYRGEFDTGVSLNADGTTTPNASRGIAWFLPIKPDTTYYTHYALTQQLVNFVRVLQYDSDKNIIGTKYINAKTFVTDTNAAYISICAAVDYFNDRYMVSESSVTGAETYEPYYEPYYVLNKDQEITDARTNMDGYIFKSLSKHINDIESKTTNNKDVLSAISSGNKYSSIDLNALLVYGFNVYDNNNVIGYEESTRRASIDVFVPKTNKLIIVINTGYMCNVFVVGKNRSNILRRAVSSGANEQTIVLNEGELLAIQVWKSNGSDFDGTESVFASANYVIYTQKIFNDIGYARKFYQVLSNDINGQGACCDDSYLYYCVLANTQKIYKYDFAQKRIVGELSIAGLGYYHVNDMAYNSTNKNIYCATMRETGIAYFNSETMEHVGFVSINGVDPTTIFGIAYDRKTNCYILGIQESATSVIYAIYDSEFNLVESNHASNVTGWTNQGLDTDGIYIYQMLHAKNAVDVYLIDGTFVNRIMLPDVTEETEAVMFDWSNGAFYMYTQRTNIGIYAYVLGVYNDDFKKIDSFTSGLIKTL